MMSVDRAGLEALLGAFPGREVTTQPGGSAENTATGIAESGNVVY